MTRRTFAGSLSGITALCACQSSRPALHTELQTLESSWHVGILNAANLSAFSASGRQLGILKLQGCCFFSPAVASGGNWVTWFPSAQSLETRSTRNNFVLLTDGSRINDINIGDGKGILSSVSSNGDQVLVLSTGPRLRVFDRTRINTQGVLNVSQNRIALSEIEWLQISASGTLATIGTRKRFIIVELSTSRVLWDAPGRCAVLSPDEQAVAFTRNGELMIYFLHLETAARAVLSGCSISGVGGWSPDGRFLLAGRMPFIEDRQMLIAIDVATGSYTDIVGIGSSDASKYVWIKKRLLSPL